MVLRYLYYFLCNVANQTKIRAPKSESCPHPVEKPKACPIFRSDTTDRLIHCQDVSNTVCDPRFLNWTFKWTCTCKVRHSDRIVGRVDSILQYKKTSVYAIVVYCGNWSFEGHYVFLRQQRGLFSDGGPIRHEQMGRYGSGTF